MVRNNVRLGSALNYFAVLNVAAHVVAGVQWAGSVGEWRSWWQDVSVCLCVSVSGSLCFLVFVCKLDRTGVKFGSTHMW